MADEKVRVHATVRVEIELDAFAWGGDCQTSQVYEQAKRETLATIRSKFPHVRILGATVTAVLVPENS